MDQLYTLDPYIQRKKPHFSTASRKGIKRTTFLAWVFFLFLGSFILGYQWAKLTEPIPTPTRRVTYQQQTWDNVYAFLWESDDQESRDKETSSQATSDAYKTVQVPTTVAAVDRSIASSTQIKLKTTAGIGLFTSLNQFSTTVSSRVEKSISTALLSSTKGPQLHTSTSLALSSAQFNIGAVSSSAELKSTSSATATSTQTISDQTNLHTSTSLPLSSAQFSSGAASPSDEPSSSAITATSTQTIGDQTNAGISRVNLAKRLSSLRGSIIPTPTMVEDVRRTISVQMVQENNNATSLPPIAPTPTTTMTTTTTGGVMAGTLPSPKATTKSSTEPNRDQITVVTAYFDLGSFEKGSPNNIFTKQKYFGWMKTFKNIQNPLVGYFDTNETMEIFRQLRAHLPANRTRLFLVQRSNLWSFSLRDQIGEIFKIPSYPKFSPNTVVPEYSCAMHAKYELINTAITDNHFKTKYFCWLDIGLFRSISEGKDAFVLSLPKGFDPSRIAYQEVSPRNPALDPSAIFRGNLFWVCGCFFLGEKGLLLKWTTLYKDYVVKYIGKGLMNTDQQVIYAMFSTHGNQPKPAVELQTYKPDGRFDPWFSLGYLCKEAGGAG